VAVLELLQAFFKHQPPVFDSHYILRYLSVSVCSRKDGAILSRIIAFSRDNGMRHAMFADEDTSPSLLAAKSGNLSAVKALQDEGTFDCTCRDMETGLNAAQFAIMNGHDDVLEHIMYCSPGTCIAARPSSACRSLPVLPDALANTSSYGDTTLHILVFCPSAMSASGFDALIDLFSRLGQSFLTALLLPGRCSSSVIKRRPCSAIPPNF
jgi:hypothetical protein